MNPGDLIKITKEELIDRLERLNEAYDEAEAEMSAIRSELLERLGKKDGEIIGEYSVKRAKRITFKTSLEEAKSLGAIKDAVDTEVLRNLHGKGVVVPGTNVTEYLSVRRINEN